MTKYSIRSALAVATIFTLISFGQLIHNSYSEFLVPYLALCGGLFFAYVLTLIEG